MKLFSLELTATQITGIVGLNPKTVGLLIKKIRMRISLVSKSEAPMLGEFEADESYFGPCRVKGKRGRGAGSKTIVFGLYKRNGKVYTAIVPDTKAKTLQAADIESVIHDGRLGRV